MVAAPVTANEGQEIRGILAGFRGLTAGESIEKYRTEIRGFGL
jgi:hypothetical protein